MTDRSFERANDESRTELARLVEALTPEQRRIGVGGGWTVDSVLAHMGFWDRWQGGRLSAMADGTWTIAGDVAPAVEHLANEALDPYWAAIDLPALPSLALAAATAVDTLIVRLPDATIDAVDQGPSDELLHRHRHRREHIAQIHRAIQP